MTRKVANTRTVLKVKEKDLIPHREMEHILSQFMTPQ
ncbi:MAG: hypothetical protein K0Q90_998 [Paenibacillaceae bacterium]|nr:hypothetical protein [Paenibacillaceae bacterium]